MGDNWFRKNQGFKLKRDNITVDVIVRGIRGSRRRREADLEIRGSPYYTSPHIKWGEEPITLEEGLNVQISDNKKTGSQNVYLFFDAAGYSGSKQYY